MVQHVSGHKCLNPSFRIYMIPYEYLLYDRYLNGEIGHLAVLSSSSIGDARLFPRTQQIRAQSYP